MNETLKTYYEYLRKAGADTPDTFESFGNTLSDEASAKQYYEYLKSGGFDAPDTFDSFSNTLGIKKKVFAEDYLPTFDNLQKSYSDKKRREQQFLAPQTKSVNQTKYEDTLPEDITIEAVNKADKSRMDYLSGEAKKIEAGVIERVRQEAAALSKKYQGPELEQKLDDLYELRSGEMQKAVETLAGKTQYKYIDKEVKNYSDLFGNILDSNNTHGQKVQQIADLRQNILNSIPEEGRAVVKGELNRLISDLATQSPMGQQFLLKTSVATTRDKLMAAHDKLKAETEEKMRGVGIDPTAIATAPPMFEKEVDELSRLQGAIDFMNRALDVPESKEGAIGDAFKSELGNILTAGVSGLLENIEVMQSARKDNPTEADKALVDAYGQLQQLQGLASDNVDRYRRAKSLVGSIPYMEQFLLTGGIGDYASTTAKKVGESVLKKGIKNRIAQAAVKRLVEPVTEGAISMIGRVPIMPMTYQNITEAGIAIKEEDGKFVVDPAQMPTIGEAIGKGVYKSATEVFSESLGGVLALPKWKWVDKIITPSAKKLFTRVGMQNPFGEYGEEIFANLFQGEKIDREFLGDLLMTIPIMTGGFAVLSTPAIVSDLKMAKKKVPNAPMVENLIEAKDEKGLLDLVTEAVTGKTKAEAIDIVEGVGAMVQENVADEMTAKVDAPTEKVVGKNGNVYTPEILIRESGKDKVRVLNDNGEEVSSLTMRTVEVDGEKYWSVVQLATATGEENNGLATAVYRQALNNLPEGYVGIISPGESRINKTEVPRVHQKLAAEFDMEVKENGDIIFKRPPANIETPIETKTKSGTQVSPEANVPIPTQDIIETPTEITEEVSPAGENVAEAVPEAIPLPSFSETESRFIDTAEKNRGKTLDRMVISDYADKIAEYDKEERSVFHVAEATNYASTTPQEWLDEINKREDGKEAIRAIGERYTGHPQAERILDVNLSDEWNKVSGRINDWFLNIQRKTQKLDTKGVALLKSAVENSNMSLQEASDLVDTLKGNKAEDIAEAIYTWYQAKEIKAINEAPWYHGTNETFTEFSTENIGKTDDGWWGKGIYFHTDPDRGGYGSKVKRVKPKLTKPFIIPSDRNIVYDLFKETLSLPKSLRGKSDQAVIKEIGSDVFTETLKQAGYDGVVVEYEEGTKELVVFDPKSIEVVNQDINAPTRAETPQVQAAPLNDVQEPDNFTGREQERMAEIEKIVAAEGFRFDVEPDSDPAMSSIDIYRANLNVGYDELPQGIKDLADEYTQLIHSAGLRTDYETPLVDVDAPPPAEPTVVEQTEQPRGEERTILRRVIESAEVDQEVKNDLLEQGIEYIPRGRRFTHAEAQELINVFGSTEGGIDKLFSTVKDMSNGILPDTRTVLNVYVAEQYSKQLDSATDVKTRDQLRKKVADAYMVGAELATMHGQAVEAQKKWQEILARDPEVIIVTKKRRQSENNKDALEDMAGDVKASEEFLTENIANSDEFKKILEERVSEEIDKIANKKYGKIDKKKIDDFFDGLLIKTDKAFDATLGIPIAAWNGAILVIKKAVLTGVDISNAVAQGVEYINAWYKEKYDKGEIPSPDWNKDDYTAVMPERLKPLTKTVKKVRYKLPKKAEDTIVDKLYDKMATATKPQLRRLVREYVATLEEEGVVSSDRFKDLFAKAIGLEVLSVEDEQTIRLAGQSINYARKKADTLMDAFNDYLKEAEQETPDKAKLAEIEADIKRKKKDANKARFAAQKAAQQLDKLLQEELELGQTLSTLIQGNLLTPISLMSNVIGNTTFLPVRGAARMVASALDNMVYGLARAYTPLVKKIDPQKHPRLARLANGLPTPTRIYRNFASLRGFAIGFKRGAIEGALQLYTGQLSEDIYRREASRGLEPVKAAMRFYNQLTGKEQARFDKLLSDFLEAMPAGYFAEGFFRALNLGDKPFRRAAETGRLYEIAQMKGLRGKAKEAFLSNPDADTLEEMRKAGELSVYQQDNIVSDLMKYLSQKLNKVNASKEHKRRSIVAKTLGSLAKATTVPFVKTPTNLIAEAFEYAIPVVTAARGVYAMKNGDRRKATDLFGKAIVGQMFVSLAVYLLKSGLLTPPPDDDDKIRQAQYEGKRGYSFNPDAAYRAMTGGDPTWQNGDRVWSYQRLGVPSMMLMGIINAYSEVPQDKIADLSYVERSIAMLPGIASGALDQSFLTGVSTALTAFIEGEAKFNDWFINTTKALSAAVYPNTVAQISQTFFSNNYIREVRDMYSEDERLKRRMVNTFKDRLFMAKDLPTKVTIWGEDVKRIPEGRSWPYMFFDVTKETKYQRTTFGVKMYEMYERYRLVDEEEAKNIIPSLPSATVEVGWDKRNMTAMEVNELQKKVGTLRRMYVERLMSSEEWMDMTDEERITELQSIYRDASTKVKSEMFMLDIVKASDKWEFLRANDFIPVPTSSITINGKRITGEEAANFYDQVQRLFVLELGGMPDGKVSDDMREDYKKDVEKAWARAKRDITNEWRDEIPEPEE